jgi:hypothetical protein
MGTAEELIGIWSADARYSAGAPSDEMLLFKEDGTGRMEFWNWRLCSADFFHWRVVSPGIADLIGFRCLELPEEGDDPVETESTFHHVRVPFSVAEEDTPSGERMRVLRIGLAHPYPSVLGFRRRDFAGWEEPRF